MRLRTDVDVFRYPDRHGEEGGGAMWELVNELASLLSEEGLGEEQGRDGDPRRPLLHLWAQGWGDQV